MKKLIFLVALGAFLSACSLTGPKPDLSIVDLQFGEVSLFETNLIVKIRITNEENQLLELEGGVHKLYFNGEYIGQGRASEHLQVPAFGSVTQEIKIALSNLSMATKIRSLVESSNLDYRIESTLYRSGPFGSRDIKLVEKDSLDLRT